MVTIATKSEADAACIARELDAFGSQLEQAEQGWWVRLAADSEIAGVLNALERCLSEHGIESVTVTYAGRSYVMERAEA